jgi:hypothetical protein
MTILVDFKEKVGRENILKAIIRNEGVYEISNGNGAGVVNLPHQKIWL